ncbi:insecticidal toxin complex protein TccC [Pseudomonas sp. GGS8]|uniref:RHS repeat domain-containing protein n=1 Tax=Pseudomonas sp. GGS8 TaxID=2817892 RepID=UPI0020A1051C|nr:RHS repeat-associated core domain-containing protein [Pseudomonas sp. GGS8]MCP1443547.1 insecticidal toxin complex protein TccC [Pseudomonas sp. GGS8]
MGMHHNTPTLTVVDPRGLSIRSVDYWRAVENVPAEARINRIAYDAAGRAAEQWDPRLWALSQEEPLTPANLTTAFSLSGNALFTYSVDAGWQLNLPGLGREVLSGWDSCGTRREVEYDDLRRPVAVFEQGTTEPRRSVERMAYGGPDHGEQNQCGQLIRHDDPAGTVLFEAFSITGQCVKQVRHFTLDPVAPDGPELEADRQRLLEPGEGAVSTWRFGPLGDVLEQIDAKKNRQAFSLTLEGRLREARLQLQGLTTWQTLVSDIQYNAEGQIEREVAGNGVRTTLGYRPEDGLLMERRSQDADARMLQHLIYDYDPMGNVLSIEDKALPVRYFANQRIDPLSRFGYDSLYQLIEAFGWEAGGPNQGPGSVGRTDPAAVSNYRQTYRYDTGGNLLQRTHVGAQDHGREMKAARYGNRCLPWRNGVPPTEDEIAAAFDANGNLLELDQGRLLTWDLRNQLQSVSPVERASGRNDRESYLYNGGGQRVRKIRSLQTNARTVVADVRYLPGLELRTDNGTAEVLQVITAQAGLNSVRVLHWESTPPSGTNDQYRYGFIDHLGSISLELAHDGRIISRENFYPFGETAYLAGDDVIEVSYKTVRYSGKERDATGLYYYGFRYYVPWLQRWINPDPAGDVDGLNFYAMVINNPLTLWDADGLTNTGNYEVKVGLKEKLALKVSKLKVKISVFDTVSGKYKESDEFKVVEVEMGSKYLVSGDEVKKNLKEYRDIYKAHMSAASKIKPGGEESNSSLGESVSGYMLRSANDTFVEEANTYLDPPNMHPDTFVERRFFAVLKRSDKNKLPEQRKIYGLTELSTLTEKGKTEVTIIQTVVHPDTQVVEDLPGRAPSNKGSMGRLPLMRGIGTYLTVQSLAAVSKPKDVVVKKVITEAINPRSAKIALKFGAKLVK